MLDWHCICARTITLRHTNQYCLQIWSNNIFMCACVPYSLLPSEPCIHTQLLTTIPACLLANYILLRYVYLIVQCAALRRAFLDLPVMYRRQTCTHTLLDRHYTRAPFLIWKLAGSNHLRSTHYRIYLLSKHEEELITSYFICLRKTQTILTGWQINYLLFYLNIYIYQSVTFIENRPINNHSPSYPFSFNPLSRGLRF